MPTPEVIERVRDLRAQLAATPPDAAHAQDRADLQKAIDVVLLEPTQREQYTSLSDRLELVYEKFEVDHPALALTVQATIRALEAAGL